MANRYPLKHQADGDIQRFTRDEEHWLAYQASLRLMMDDSTAPYQLSTLSGNTVGSFTDTFFNEAVGTHPGSALSTGSTVTTLYQRNGSDLDSANANFRTPLNVESNSDIGEMSSVEFYELSKRLAGHAMVNEYLGSFRLNSSAPAGYTVHLSNVFSDTQTDGTTVNYSIYKRTSGVSEPTKVNPMSIKRSGGYTGTFQGLQAMDSAQCVYTLGNHMKYYMMDSSGNIGNYQLRSSAQGAPTLAGTWSARGTATDTKKTTADADYTRNSTRNQDENFTSVYETTYTGNYTGDFIGDFTGNFTGDFTGDFVGTYIGNFVGDDAITYTLNSTRNSTRSSTNPDSIDYLGNYIDENAYNFLGNYGADYVGDYVAATNYFEEEPTFPENYLGNYAADYLGDYAGPQTFAGNFTGPQSFTGDFTGNFTGNFLGPQDFTRNQDENFTRNSTAASTRNSTGNSTADAAEDYVGTFTGDFVGTYTGDFTGNFLGETIQSSSETIETYTLYVRVA